MKNEPIENLEKCPLEMQLICNLKQATTDDFRHQESGWSNWKRNYGQPYFLVNSDGVLETYRVSDMTDPAELNQFIQLGRCYVFKSISLDDVVKELESQKSTP
jgi:hypothetical protein